MIAVESSYSGGTRWQVELAISQKKTVIAIEPEISNKLSYDGYKQFVLKGALPAKNVTDVLEILNRRIKTQYQMDDYEIEDEDMEPLLTK